MFSEDQAFALLKRRIHLDRGLDCEQYKENYLKRRIAVRLRARDAKDYLEYIRILKNDPQEYTYLLNELTINVTQFFRDKDVYERIRDNVIPGVIESKSSIGSRTLRVWSAGCASGEEPYSMAILVDQVLGDEIGGWNVRIVGSDIDERSIRVAKAGLYGEIDVLEDMDPDRYFEKEDREDGAVYMVREDVKRRVRFEKFNLLDEYEPRHFDIIMCRNVLIYFGRDVQRRIVEVLSQSILREGYLILGKSETLGQETNLSFKPEFPRERIYRHLLESRIGIRKPADRERD